MAKIRNVSDGTLELRLDGFTVVAEVDEVVDVPDALYKSHVFPEALWADVSPPRKTTTKDEA